MQTGSRSAPGAIRDIFGRDKALIGMVHCAPLPGAPRYRGVAVDEIYDTCMRDAAHLVDGGLHGLIVENHGDIPFCRPEDIGPETSAFLSVITDRLRMALGVPLGINVRANAPLPALATAVAGGADFIRVNQWASACIAREGLIEGRAAEAMRYRSLLRAEHVRIFADVQVRQGSHAIVADRPLGELARDLALCDADCVIANGRRSGETAASEDICEIQGATDLPLLVGSGVTPDNIAGILRRTSGVILAASQRSGNLRRCAVDPERLRGFMDRAREALGD